MKNANKKYKRYPEYKPSGVDWLGEVPAGWKIYQLARSVSCCLNGVWGDDANGEDDIVVLRVADFDRNNFRIDDSRLTKRSVPESDIRKRKLRNGDLIIEKSGGGDKQLVGAVVLFDKRYNAVTSNFLAKMTPDENMCPNFLVYAHAHLYSRRVNYRSIKQTTGIQNIDSSAYLSEYFSFPPLPEQRAIATFLDRETGKIDRMVERQGRMIELLQEKRQAVISHAVTKGLDPDAPMKDSGVEWLGEIPAGWEVSRIKFATAINPSKNEVRHLADETLVTFLPMEAIGVRGELDLSLTKKLIDVKSGYTYLAENDIIIAKITPCFENGKGAIAAGLENGIAFATTEVIPIRTKRPSDSRFFYYLLKSDPFHSMAEGSMYGAGGQKRVSDGFVAEYCFSLPPPAERDAIATFLDIETTKIDRLIAKAKRAIELMKERRTALISAAVTGKIDVRGQGRGRPRPHLGGVEK